MMQKKVRKPKLHKKLRKPSQEVESYKLKISQNQILFQFEISANYTSTYFGYYNEVLFKSKESFELYDGKLCNLECSEEYILVNHFSREEIFNFSKAHNKFHPQLVRPDICGYLFIHTYNSQIEWLLYQFVSTPFYENMWIFFRNEHLEWTNKAESCIVDKTTPSFSITKHSNHTVDAGIKLFNPFILVMEFQTVIGVLKWEANRISKSQCIRRVTNNERFNLPVNFEFDELNRHINTLSIDYEANLTFTVENNNFWDIYKIDLKRAFNYS